MKHWKDMPAFFNLKGIRRNSKRPNGVMIAVFFTSEGWTLDRYLVVALLQVELAEDGGPCQAAGDVCHVGEGVAVILGDQVQAVEIAT